MRAMVFTAPGTVEMRDEPEPSAAPGEVLVNVAVAGICGSELHGIRAPGFRTPPLIMGHEFAGTTGDGTRVVVNPLVTCGACDRCRAGESNLCRERALIGVHRAGGFAERVAVPERNVLPMSDGMSWERAAAVEPLANAVHAWRIAGAAPSRVGVIGAGPIGLVCLLIARRHGVTDVMVTDLSEERLETARRLGASETAAELSGEFDLIFDAVGLPPTHRAGVERLRPGGMCVWLGLITELAEFDAQHLIRMEKRVLGSFAYTEVDFGEALAIASELDASWVQPFPLEQGAEVFTQLMNGRSDVVKAVLEP